MEGKNHEDSSIAPSAIKMLTGLCASWVMGQGRPVPHRGETMKNPSVSLAERHMKNSNGCLHFPSLGRFAINGYRAAKEKSPLLPSDF
jgi:hypothetical protein